MQWRDQLLEGATGVFGAAIKSDAEPATVVKILHAMIGELTPVNDFLSGALDKAGLLPRAKDVGLRKPPEHMPSTLRKITIYDRGSEMACHAELAHRLKFDIWFCDPLAPWQRGSNENTNGLLCQFMPKGTDLSDASQTWLNDVARLMNERPRKTLGWKTPAEAMAEEIRAFNSTVALDL